MFIRLIRDLTFSDRIETLIFNTFKSPQSIFLIYKINILI